MRTAVFAIALGLSAVQPALAQDNNAPIEVMRAGDADLTCMQISEETAQLSASMGEERASMLGRLGGVATAGAAMVIPGAGLVTAAAEALTQPERDSREARENAIEQRWYYLNGIYTAQRCQARAEAAEAAAATPQAAPMPATPMLATPAPAQPVSVPAPRVQPTTLSPSPQS